MERNLITLYRTYYRLGIPNFIGTSSHAIFTGLLYKFNELGFPETIKISIREMLSLSGIDIRTFRQARKALCEYLHDADDPSSWIVKYTENEIKEYGTYTINYAFLLINYNNETKLLQSCDNNATILQQSSNIKLRDDKIKGAVFDPISAKNALLSNTIQDNTKQYSFCEERENVSSEVSDEIEKKEEKDFQETKKMLQRVAGDLKVSNLAIGNAIRKISKYPIEQRKAVIESAALAGKDSGHILGYVINGLENYNTLYASKTERPLTTKEMMEKSDRELAEMTRRSQNIINGIVEDE